MTRVAICLGLIQLAWLGQVSYFWFISSSLFIDKMVIHIHSVWFEFIFLAEHGGLCL
jgi:hypothetical protein